MSDPGVIWTVCIVHARRWEDCQQMRELLPLNVWSPCEAERFRLVRVSDVPS